MLYYLTHRLNIIFTELHSVFYHVMIFLLLLEERSWLRRSQELLPGFPSVYKVPRSGAMVHCFPMHIGLEVEKSGLKVVLMQDAQAMDSGSTSYGIVPLLKNRHNKYSWGPSLSQIKSMGFLSPFVTITPINFP